MKCLKIIVYKSNQIEYYLSVENKRNKRQSSAEGSTKSTATNPANQLAKLANHNGLPNSCPVPSSEGFGSDAKYHVGDPNGRIAAYLRKWS